MTKKIFFLLLGIGLISVFFSVVQRTPSPPCLNADEASFGYNAYSILKTGKDEYGTFLPLRLKSFGDYKLPLYTYFSIPFIAVFGLNEFGTRALNIFLSFLLPFAVYLLAVELFKSKRAAVVSAFLTGISLGLHIISRHAHEAYLATFLTTFTCYFLVKSLKNPRLKNMLLLAVSSLLLLFSYHPGRMFVLFFLGFAFMYSPIRKQKNLNVPFMLFVVFVLFTLTDLTYSPTRLKNLVFFNNEGFNLKIQELKTEGGIRYLYHPLFIGLKEITLDHLTYFSPQFLIQNGDQNTRFGFPGMSILTPLEYIFFFIVLYHMFKNKERWRWFFLILLAISPLSASFSWSKESLTRSLFLLVPVIISASYGINATLHQIKKDQRVSSIFVLAAIGGFFLLTSWDYYLFHYPKQKTAIRSWQCGYKEVGEYVRENYQKYSHFYLSKDVGMPYIFMLFYLKYDPESYQRQASLTPPDEYGFGQVEKFDKFIFEFKWPKDLQKNSALIGSVDDFKNIPEQYKVDSSKLTSVRNYSEIMFQIYKGN